MEFKNMERIEEIVNCALAEDLSRGDPTTDILIPEYQEGEAYLIAREDGVLAGVGVSTIVFQRLDSALRVNELVRDSSRIYAGDKLSVIGGKVASILSAERVALNFLQHLSGIATETARYVEAIYGTKALIKDTRKTTPGLRLLEKYAVRMGGGHNHRDNLGDSILIKDNHLIDLSNNGVGLKEAIKKARENVSSNLKIEVEVESVDQARDVLLAGADIIMLDNMSSEEMRKVVGEVNGRALIEASGGITLNNVYAVASTGVDWISIGALTHSVKALDISLELEGR